MFSLLKHNLYSYGKDDDVHTKVLGMNKKSMYYNIVSITCRGALEQKVNRYGKMVKRKKEELMPERINVYKGNKRIHKIFHDVMMKPATFIHQKISFFNIYVNVIKTA